jgi:CDP-glucose 4,6-dehydratase
MAEDTSPWRGRRVLVTGCTGFLGGAVARELVACGADVIGLVNERPASDLCGEGAGRIHFLHGRTDNVFRLHSAMAVHEITTIFHLAAHDPFGEDRGTLAVLQAAKLYSRRVPIVTAQPLRQLALTQSEEPQDRLSVARFGEVFGPGDRKLFRVVPATAISLLTGETATFPADGAARDFVFIRDAALACLRVAEAARMTVPCNGTGSSGRDGREQMGPREYSFRSGWLMSDRQMAAAVRDVHAGHPPAQPDSAAPTNPLGWHPQQPLAEALEASIAWYREFLRVGSAVPVRAAA